MSDKFFSDLRNTKPYFKCGFEGFAGSGKSFTSGKISIGLHGLIESTKPIVIFDTETSSKFLKPMYERAGIEVLVKRSKSIADLKEVMTRMRNGLSDILIIDSISHVWEDFLEAYKAKKSREFLQFQDWGFLKPAWKREFTDLFVGDPYHILMCGRAGYEYSNEINDETRKREIFKSGIKMKVEGETAYEPDMLVLMERYEQVLGNEPKQVWREAMILKDRSDILDGKTIKNPSFNDFKPSVLFMMENPQKDDSTIPIDAGTLIDDADNRQEYIKNKKIKLEEIQNALIKKWPSTGGADKKARLEAAEKAFGVTSWIAIEDMKLEELETCYIKLVNAISGNDEKPEKPAKKPKPRPEDSVKDNRIKRMEDWWAEWKAEFKINELDAAINLATKGKAAGRMSLNQKPELINTVIEYLKANQGYAD